MKTKFKEYSHESIKQDMSKRKTLNVEIIQDGNVHHAKFIKGHDERIFMESNISDKMDLNKPADYRIVSKKKSTENY